MDRGLQPGTGTYDLLVGVYHYGILGPGFSYFAQALVQEPLNTREEFRPGTGLNVNFGIRYLGNPSLIPQVQLNARAERREAGANADVVNSGAVLLFVGPGVTVSVARGLHAYAFVQLPLYQNVNGYEIESRYSASIGMHFQP